MSGYRETHEKKSRIRKTVHWVLLWVMVATIALGWKYPVLGYSVPLVMIMGVVGSFFNGRYVCGHLCPRGGFLDRILALVSFNRPVPKFVRNAIFRWAVAALLFSFMIFRIIMKPEAAGWFEHLGLVFWVMCVVTTLIALVAGIFIHPRLWCSACPVGTMSSAIGGGKNLLQYDGESCVMCRACEKACPIGLPISDYKETGVMSHPDCLKCPECIAACPREVLKWPADKDKKSA